MNLTHEGAVPELDRIERLPLMRLLLNHELSDQGISIKFRGQPFGRDEDCEFYAPRLLGAYHGRQLHMDKGLHAHILFSDENIVREIREQCVKVADEVQEKLRRGVFCLDLNKGIVGYNPVVSDFEGRDAYRLSVNVNGVFATEGTSIDILNEALAMNFDLRLFEAGHHEVRFLDPISKEEISKFSY